MVSKRWFTLVTQRTVARSRRLVSIGFVLAMALAPCLTTQLTLRLHASTTSVESVQTNNAVITVTLQGLEPDTVTISSGHAVTWHNVSGLTQTLRFQRAYRINLPMITQTRRLYATTVLQIQRLK
jgi:plastocyanin